MREVKNIIDYLRIICDPIPNIDNNHNDYYLSNMNEIIKDFKMHSDYLSEGDKLEDFDKHLEQFITYYYEYLYSFVYKKNGELKLNNDKKQDITFFYRGVSNGKYPISSGIYRENEQHEEKYYFNEIGVRCPESFKMLNNLEKLTYMQHYGCPTRLLDITSNPLVALYFACLDEDADGTVYVFGVDSNEVLYSDSDRIQMLSKLAEFNKKEQRELRFLAYKYILKNKFPQHSSGKYRHSILEQFYHSIKRYNGAFEREIVPFDILKPQFVQPNKDNPRILKQDGAFIISGLDEDYKESDIKIRKYVVEEIRIHNSDKKTILKELEYVGINQATLFPEVDKVADYLRHRN